MEVALTIATIAAGVALGLALFQWAVLPIGNFIGRVKETVDERDARRNGR